MIGNLLSKLLYFVHGDFNARKIKNKIMTKLFAFHLIRSIETSRENNFIEYLSKNFQPLYLKQRNDTTGLISFEKSRLVGKVVFQSGYFASSALFF